MKVTKANIIKAVEEATGIKPDLKKYDNSYHWIGKESCLFSDACTYVSTFSQPNAPIERFVKDFKQKVADVEREYDKPIAAIIDSINWDIELE
jgi:hypothetical protein